MIQPNLSTRGKKKMMIVMKESKKQKWKDQDEKGKMLMVKELKKQKWKNQKEEGERRGKGWKSKISSRKSRQSVFKRAMRGSRKNFGVKQRLLEREREKKNTEES